MQWIQDGSSWLIATQNSFSVHSLQNGLVQEWKYPTRLVCICALSDSIFVVGGMDGYVRVSRWLWVWVCVSTETGPSCTKLGKTNPFKRIKWKEVVLSKAWE